MPSDLAEQLKQAIRDSGLSLSELGQQSAVSHTVLSRFMRNERTLTLPLAAKVSRALGLQLQGGKTAVEPQSAEKTAALNKLIEAATPLLDELDEWGRTSEYSMSPAAIRKIAVLLRRAINAATQATIGADTGPVKGKTVGGKERSARGRVSPSAGDGKLAQTAAAIFPIIAEAQAELKKSMAAMAPSFVMERLWTIEKMLKQALAKRPG